MARRVFTALGAVLLAISAVGAGAIANAPSTGAAEPPATQQISVPGTTSGGLFVSVSGTGRFVALGTDAALVADDTNGVVDVYVRDMVLGTLTLVSRAADGVGAAQGMSFEPSINTDGTRVAFTSDADDLISGDGAIASFQVYVRNLVTGTTIRVSNPLSGSPTGAAFAPSISGSGDRVAFSSDDPLLATGGGSDHNLQIYVRDIPASVTIRASVSPTGDPGDSFSDNPSLSGNGQFVAFESFAVNLVAGDTNAREDVFVRDLALGTTTRVSVATNGNQSDGLSFTPSINSDGSRIAFTSTGTNLDAADTVDDDDVFLYDRTTTVPTTSLASLGSPDDSNKPSISADGRHIAFISLVVESNGSTHGGVLVRDLAPGPAHTSRVSVTTSGAVETGSAEAVSTSDDGSFIGFVSTATDLVDSDGLVDGVVTNDVFLRDRTGVDTTKLVSRAPDAMGASTSPSANADGRFVAFGSASNNIAPNDSNPLADVFLRDLTSGTSALLSPHPEKVLSLGPAPSLAPSISADGTRIAFLSDAKQLVDGDTNNARDVFVRDLRGGDRTIRVSVGAAGEQANGPSSQVKISADGNHVAFTSAASNLVPGDNGGSIDVFVRDLDGAGTTSRVSVNATGGEIGNHSLSPAIDADGSRVAFESDAANVVLNDTNAQRDVFVRDRTAGTTTRVSLAAGGAQGDGASLVPSISGDGLTVAYESVATNLVAGDTNAKRDVFVSTASGTTRASVATSGAQATGDSFEPSIDAAGTRVAFSSAATDLVAGDTNNASDIFVRSLAGTPSTSRASVTATGAEANGASVNPSISGDGTHVAFGSVATNLGINDANGQSDVFLRRLTIPEGGTTGGTGGTTTGGTTTDGGGATTGGTSGLADGGTTAGGTTGGTTAPTTGGTTAGGGTTTSDTGGTATGGTSGTTSSGATGTRSSRGTLPNSGANTWRLVAVGLGLLGLGLIAMGQSAILTNRRRHR